MSEQSCTCASTHAASFGDDVQCSITQQPLSIDSEIGHGNYSQSMPAEYDPKVDYYAILCVETTATAADIRKAHRARINELHPDRGGDTTRASVVNFARDVLSKPNLRREYDQARRDWILKSLQSPLIQAFLDADRQIADSVVPQASTHGSGNDARRDPATTHPSPTASTGPQAPRPGRNPIAGVSRL